MLTLGRRFLGLWRFLAAGFQAASLITQSSQEAALYKADPVSYMIARAAVTCQRPHLWGLSFSWKSHKLLFKEVVSAGIEMDDLDVVSTDHLPAGRRPETWLVQCPVLGSLASALIDC